MYAVATAQVPGSFKLVLKYRLRDTKLGNVQSRHAHMYTAMAASPTPIINVGSKFSSFDELEIALESYKKSQYVEFWRRDSRTIAAAQKRGIARPLRTELKYYEIKYCCIHGGQAFKARGSGKRNSS